MSRSRVVLAVLFCAALLTPLTAADAGSSVLCTGYSSCTSKGYSHAGYSSKQGTSYWRMYTGTNCTNYVAYRLVTTNGMPNTRPKSGVGNARDWGTTMSSITDSTPNVGSVAWWGRTGNHVAYVEKVVSSTEIWVSESNWSGAFDWRKITKSGSGWPDGFIHFADRKIVNNTKPEIRGTAKVGSKLTAAGSDWTPKGNTYTYSWRADGKAISGATAKTFTPTATQLGTDLTVRMTATRPSYPTLSVTSKAVEVAPGTLASTEAPTITGTPRVDSALKATPGTWSPAGTSYAYQWLVGGTPVSGATAATFTPRPADVDKPVSVAVTASRSGYAKVTKTSAATAGVAPGPLSATRKPSIAGTPKVGSRMTASPGTWSTSGLTFTYQWYVDGTAVSGATASTFVPRAADVARTVTVRVTASRRGYATTSATSPATAAVARGTLTSVKRPTVTGTARVGSRLTASKGTWSHAADVSYRWYADGKQIAGATAQTYVPTSRQLGTKIRVRVTAHADGFDSAAASSANTDVVARGVIRLTSEPAVTGSKRLGAVLKIDAGEHTPSGATVRYQWLRDGKTLSGATSRSHRVKTGDLGHRLSARVTYSAPGYTTRSATTAKVGPAKATSTLKVAATPARRKATFTIVVSAAGVAAPDGTVRIGTAGGESRSAKVVRGRATVTLTGQRSGTRTYVIRFGGTAIVTSAERTKTVTIS